MSVHPPEPRLVHRLPPAPAFVGRDAELAQLRQFWQAGSRGVLALVGLGGAGKTAVATRFLEDLLAGGVGPMPRGLFVWSFYQEPDAGQFLEEALRYFGRGQLTDTSAHGAGFLHLLRDALQLGGPHLLVLDGLERVQRQETAGAFGQIEDPLLRGLLTRIAEGIGQTAALVTSRFPLTDLDSFKEQGYRHLDVGGLDRGAAVALLRRRGVHGDDAALAELVEAYGAHALTLDHLGGLIGQFLEGDPRRAPEAPALAAPGSDRQALRLARLLRTYEDHLPAAELALLSQLCLLRRSVKQGQLNHLVLCSPPVHARTVRDLADRIARFPGANKVAPDDLRDLAEAIQATVTEALCRVPIAGPEETFRQEILFVADAVLEVYEKEITFEVEEIARLYADTTVEVPTDLRPLPPEDRNWLRALCARYTELRNHGLLFYGETDPTLDQAFIQMGWKPPRRGPVGDLWRPFEALTQADIRTSFRRVENNLRSLIVKHFALKRVRELCRVYQRKWELAGLLAVLGAAELHEALGALVGRHLVLRESDGSYSVHPAVRDYFQRRATAAAPADWHDVVREQLLSLVRRPGKGLPEDPATLDLVEEAIYHALQAGRSENAWWLFTETLGGLRHLAWKLGELARGLRIVRQFDPCPDRWALAWFLRGLGELEEAYRHNDFAYFRADLRLLQGRLPEVAAEGDDGRTAIAQFLMGKARQPPGPALGCAVPREQALLYLGRLAAVEPLDGTDQLYRDLGWESDRARCLLLRAEAARRQGNFFICRRNLEVASRWVLHSGSAEHLCLFHLVRARLSRDEKDGPAAQAAVDEGLHLARQCGFGLYLVELLTEQAALFLSRGEPAAAEPPAREALRRAAAPECKYLWGATAAGHLLGQVLAAQGRARSARVILTRTLRRRHRVGDPLAEETARLLASL